ncbi:RNA recognition motif domain-containing protein [Vibrio viridaestus]|uniref:RNA-binding protein n=1 Tax=Vibrio viridaestus TaxID=2487322 RepID=A0A3N9TE48_9VIBR|nr:RNA-binding protein [Vibrio viridaestus]RQW62114.1 RNA-binding protein [Vibrio viridaestus]
MKLLVRNLTRSTTEHEIRVLFTNFGSVTTCNLVLDQDTGHSKGFAFVEMPNEEEAKKAMEGLDMTSLAQNKIRVRIAHD